MSYGYFYPCSKQRSQKLQCGFSCCVSSIMSMLHMPHVLKEAPPVYTTFHVRCPAARTDTFQTWFSCLFIYLITKTPIFSSSGLLQIRLVSYVRPCLCRFDQRQFHIVLCRKARIFSPWKGKFHVNCKLSQTVNLGTQNEKKLFSIFKTSQNVCSKLYFSNMIALTEPPFIFLFRSTADFVGSIALHLVFLIVWLCAW